MTVRFDADAQAGDRRVGGIEFGDPRCQRIPPDDFHLRDRTGAAQFGDWVAICAQLTQGGFKDRRSLVGAAVPQQVLDLHIEIANVVLVGEQGAGKHGYTPQMATVLAGMG